MSFPTTYRNNPAMPDGAITQDILARTAHKVAEDGSEYSTVEAVTPATLVTLSGFFLLAGSRVRVAFQVRKSAHAGSAVVGLTINGTSVIDNISSPGNAEVAAGWVIWEYTVPSSSYPFLAAAQLYEEKIWSDSSNRTAGLQMVQPNVAPIPNGPHQSVAITGLGPGAPGIVAVRNLKVWDMG